MRIIDRLRRLFNTLGQSGDIVQLHEHIEKLEARVAVLEELAATQSKEAAVATDFLNEWLNGA